MSDLMYSISAYDVKINRNFNFLKDPHENFFDYIENGDVILKS